MKHYLFKFIPIIFPLFTSSFLSTAQSSVAAPILWTANWSPDNQYFVIGSDDGLLRIFNGETFELIRVDTIGSDILRVRWHPTKNILAVAAIHPGTCLIDFDTNRTIYLKGIPELSGRAIAWNCDGELIAFADYEGRLSVWTREGRLVNLIEKGATKSYVAVDWHPKKNEMIALSEYVRIYDLKGKLLQKFKHRKEAVLMLCVKWHPSSDFFVIGDYGDYDYNYPALLQYWHPDGILREEIVVSNAEYRNISWSNDQQYLATASDALRIWNVEGQLLYEGISPDLLWGVDWSQDGKYIVTSSEKGRVRIWNNRAELVKELVY